MSDLVERLRDLHKQATVERSHYYVGKCALDAADHIEALEKALWEILDAHDRADVNNIARAALEQDK